MTFLLVNFAWVFFRMPNVGDAFSVIGRMFSDVEMPDLSDLGGKVMIMLFSAVAILCFKDLRDEFFTKKMQFLNSRVVQWAVYVLLFCMILNFGVLDGGQFIYVNF